MNAFLTEYWMFVEALIERSSELLGVASANRLAAEFGYPFGAALAFSCVGFALALLALSLQRPGWGLAALTVGEELSALSLTGAVIAHGIAFDGALAAVRLVAAALAVWLVTALLRKSVSFSRGKAPAAQ